VSPTLSVVVPVYNEAPHLAQTIDGIVGALQQTDFDAELVLVDDGSTDQSADAAAAALRGRLPLTQVSQPNRGRFHAVREGLRRATGQYVLVLGARVRLRPDALAFVRERLRAGELVWTGHVHIHTEGNRYGTFMNVITEIAWRDYFDDPRPLTFGLEDFDRYPKGSGCFIAPREVLLDAFDAIPTRYADARFANDDAPMLRRIAAVQPIHVAPTFASDYVPRATFRTFIKHSIHRGTVFLDGHGRRESRFFPFIVAFYPLSATLAAVIPFRPRLLPVTVAMVSIGAGTVAASARRSRSEVVTVAALAPIWATALGAGLWRGLGMIAVGRLRSLRADQNHEGDRWS
jgi:glycosyltransferase involved in cell wall biosynthesis